MIPAHEIAFPKWGAEWQPRVPLCRTVHAVTRPLTPLSSSLTVSHSRTLRLVTAVPSLLLQASTPRRPRFPNFGFTSPARLRHRAAMASAGGAPAKVHKSDEEWQAVLSPEQFRILRKKGTEYPDTGEYNKTKDEGVYGCAGCGTPLYKSTTKFDSGCGWPAFFEGIPGAITETRDSDGRRVEITCSACGGHLGHVFKGEGFKNPTDARHCVNSVSLKFAPANSS